MKLIYSSRVSLTRLYGRVFYLFRLKDTMQPPGACQQHHQYHPQTIYEDLCKIVLPFFTDDIISELFTYDDITEL